MGLDHGVTKERFISLRPVIEHATSVVDASKWVCRGKERKRSAGFDECCEEINVGFNGVPEHESVDFEDRSQGVSLLEEV